MKLTATFPAILMCFFGIHLSKAQPSDAYQSETLSTNNRPLYDVNFQGAPVTIFYGLNESHSNDWAVWGAVSTVATDTRLSIARVPRDGEITVGGVSDVGTRVISFRDRHRTRIYKHSFSQGRAVRAEFTKSNAPPNSAPGHDEASLRRC